MPNAKCEMQNAFANAYVNIGIELILYKHFSPLRMADVLCMGDKCVVVTRMPRPLLTQTPNAAGIYYMEIYIYIYVYECTCTCVEHWP